VGRSKEGPKKPGMCRNLFMENSGEKNQQKHTGAEEDTREKGTLSLAGKVAQEVA